MVQRHLIDRGIDDPAVLAAMRDVPRHLFVSPEHINSAYDDQALGIWAGQTISQPYIVALMTQALALTSTSRILEVGTGSGYQSAILAHITPHVFTIEIIKELTDRARLAWNAYGCADRITATTGDGHAGWAEHAPYDAIIVTCSPVAVPPRLFEQLTADGRLCIPVGRRLESQHLLVYTKQPNGSMHKRQIIPVRFVPMTGGDD